MRNNQIISEISSTESQGQFVILIGISEMGVTATSSYNN